jgi:tRNA(Ile)-lysidine synthase
VADGAPALLNAAPHLTAALAPLLTRRRVALAVSGGPDSTALLHLAAALRDRFAAAPVVLTVDHKLRPAAAREAEAVAAAAAALGLEAEILAWTGDKPAANLQAAARAARYALLADAARRHGCDALATAHTRDDQAETFLLALARGSGVYGLAAMPASRDLGDGLTLLRPFLATPKADLVAWLDAAGIAYATDPSNADPRFARARLRAAAPALASLGLTPERLAATAQRMARAAGALDAAAAALIAAATPFGPALALLPAPLAAAPDEIGLRALARLLAAVAAAPYPPRLDRLEALHAALRAALAAGRPLKRTLGDVLVLLEPDGMLWLAPEAGRAGFPVRPLSPGIAVAWDRRTTVTLSATAPADATLAALGPSGAALARARHPAAAAAPAAIVATLPGLHLAGRLAAVPDLGLVLDAAAPPAALVRRAKPAFDEGS